MKRLTIAFALFVSGSVAEARCYRTYQTTKSSYGWNHSCYSCHKPATQAKAYGLDAARAWMFSIAKQREEHAIILKEAQALGLGNYVKASGYGASGLSQYTEQSLSYPSAQYGSTLYGYAAVQQAAPLDKMAVMNMATRLADQSNQLAGFSFQGVKELFQTATAGEIEVAKILAQGQVASQALSAARPQATTQQTSRTFTFQLQQSPEGQVTVQSLPTGPVAFDEQRFAAVVGQRCAKCHSADTPDGPKGGLDVRNLLKLDASRWEKVLARINSDDGEKRMPHEADPLPWSERALFSQAADWALRNSGQFRTQEQPQPPPNPQPPSNY